MMVGQRRFLFLQGPPGPLFRRLAEEMLQDEDRMAWRIDEGSLRWRDQCWTTEQIATVRREFFMSIGSCSFEEPMRDLEALGWL